MTNKKSKQIDAHDVISNRVKTVTYKSNGGRLYSGTYDMFVTSDGRHFCEHVDAVDHERDILLVQCLEQLGKPT